MQKQEKKDLINYDIKIKKASKLVNKLDKNLKEHSYRVALKLKEKQLGTEAILAGFLHSWFRNKKINEKEMAQLFGNETTRLLTEVLTVKKIIQRNSKLDPSLLSSMILSISEDIQTIIILIVEKIDSLEHPEVSLDLNIDTFLADEVYNPLATKLGLGEYCWMLRDASFKINNPNGYNKIKNLINKPREEREKIIEKFKNELYELLKNKKITIFGRPKNFKATYEKMKKIPFKKIHDIYATRIICNTEKDCYEILGIIHSKYDFIKEDLDDYISKGKKGKGFEGYKAIHTTIKHNNEIIEIQIRTWETHLRTESNLYWEYKQINKDKEFEKDLSWERQLVEWQKSIGQEKTIKLKKRKKLFVFTPKQDVIILPQNSTVLDFAYAVHTDLGQKIIKAKINEKPVPIESKLNNLDTITIITGEKTTVKPTWLNNVISEKAKTKIRQHFKMTSIKKKKENPSEKLMKKIKYAECCHPLPGEDVIGVKTTKRKIIIHKKDCPNLKNVTKSKLFNIEFEQKKGKTKIIIYAIDRVGLLGEILNEMTKKKIKLVSTNFQIKKTGYVEAKFEIEINNKEKLEKLLKSIENIPSVQSAERE